MNAKFPRILYFTAGHVPTAVEEHAAEQLGLNVGYRNALLSSGATGALEQCDGVAGEVPERYAKAFPTAAEALDKFREERSKALAAKKAAAQAPKPAVSVGNVSEVAAAAAPAPAPPAPAPAAPAPQSWGNPVPVPPAAPAPPAKPVDWKPNTDG